MLFLRKLLHLPSPTELGRSSRDSLPSKDFTPNTTDYSWEDWHEEVKSKHPIKYFVAETAGDFVRFKLFYPVYRPIQDAKYWVVSHIVPKRRYHMLDLRQPKNEDDIDQYRYGWLDVSERMLYAIFNLLDQFVKYEMKNYYCPTEEDILKEDNLQAQKDIYFEILEIHKWWTVDRKDAHKQCNELRNKWHSLLKQNDPQTQIIWDKMREMDDELERKTDEMIIRLIKIRRSLWT